MPRDGRECASEMSTQRGILGHQSTRASAAEAARRLFKAASGVDDCWVRIPTQYVVAEETRIFLCPRPFLCPRF